MNKEFPQAPELHTTQWFNTHSDITLESLRGRVIVMEAFQMLCPGCVSHALPQAQKIHKMFSTEDVAVIGLHTVFEHHAAMTPRSLEAFLYEYRISFPVGVDAPSKHNNQPQTMATYQLQGTPSTILIDRQGRIRKHAFGSQEDLVMGAEIMSLVQEPFAATNATTKPKSMFDDNLKANSTDGCDDDGCSAEN